MAAEDALNNVQWHGSLKKNAGTSTAHPVAGMTDKYNRPQDRVRAVPKTAAALKPDPFRKSK